VDDDRLEENRLLLLWQGERANEFESVALLSVEFTQSGAGAAVGNGRLCAPERRRHHDLVFEHEVVQVEDVVEVLRARAHLPRIMTRCVLKGDATRKRRLTPAGRPRV
jgi:hypothetical protein